MGSGRGRPPPGAPLYDAVCDGVQENSAGTKGAVPGYETGAHGRNRTGDPILTMDVLCLLSYMGS